MEFYKVYIKQEDNSVEDVLSNIKSIVNKEVFGSYLESGLSGGKDVVDMGKIRHFNKNPLINMYQTKFALFKEHRIINPEKEIKDSNGNIVPNIEKEIVIFSEESKDKRDKLITVQMNKTKDSERVLRAIANKIGLESTLVLSEKNIEKLNENYDSKLKKMSWGR